MSVAGATRFGPKIKKMILTGGFQSPLTGEDHYG